MIRANGKLDGQDEGRIKALAAAARRMLEEEWPAWHREWGPPCPAVPSQWTCFRSSLFLCMVLRHGGLVAECVSGMPRVGEDGPSLGDYGFRTPWGWQPHGWVLCSGFIVDVTADQFGEEAVIVVRHPDDRYMANNVDPALPASIERRHRVAEALMRRWRGRQG